MADAPKPAAPGGKPAPAGGKPAAKPGGGKPGGKGKAPAKASGGRRSLYVLEGSSVKRLRRACPKCGPGVFLAEHKNRFSCGNCAYTEFKK